MKKNSIKFYDFEKTEFLFESDAEKVAIKEASKPKKRTYKKIIANSFIISFFLIIGFYGASNYAINETDKLKATINNSENFEKINEKMNASSDKLEVVNNNYNRKYEVIINKANPISKTDLVKYKIVDVMDNTISNIKLEEETYNNYLRLKDNLLERGYYISIRSGYRTFEESEKIYNSYITKYGLEYAKKYVAKPGVSEHNAGIAFDFIISTSKNAIQTNYESDEYFYLENIAYLYGFIIRYPKDKETITGYSYEPWHLRYVGKDLAKYLKKNNLTLEEYYETGE